MTKLSKLLGKVNAIIPFTRIIFYTSIYAFFSEYSELTVQKKLDKIRFVYFLFSFYRFDQKKKENEMYLMAENENYKVKLLHF